LREAGRVAKGITGQIGTFEEFAPETKAKFASEMRNRRIRKMIQRAMEDV
jgi:hypothetical protein